MAVIPVEKKGSVRCHAGVYDEEKRSGQGEGVELFSSIPGMMV